MPPFKNVTLWVFITLVIIMVGISLADSRSKNNPKGLELNREDFKVSPQFTVLSILIFGVLIALYTVFY